MNQNTTIIRGTITDSYLDDDIDDTIYIVEDLHHDEYYIPSQGFIGYTDEDWESYLEESTEVSFKVRNEFL